MKNYRVVFIKRGKDGEPQQVLGTLTIDDCGVDANFTLMAKAWRQGSPGLLSADIVQISQVS